MLEVFIPLLSCIFAMCGGVCAYHGNETAFMLLSLGSIILALYWAIAMDEKFSKTI